MTLLQMMYRLKVMMFHGMLNNQRVFLMWGNEPARIIDWYHVVCPPKEASVGCFKTTIPMVILSQEASISWLKSSWHTSWHTVHQPPKHHKWTMHVGLPRHCTHDRRQFLGEISWLIVSRFGQAFDEFLSARNPFIFQDLPIPRS